MQPVEKRIAIAQELISAAASISNAISEIKMITRKRARIFRSTRSKKYYQKERVELKLWSVIAHHRYNIQKIVETPTPKYASGGVITGPAQVYIQSDGRGSGKTNRFIKDYIPLNKS